MPNIQRPYGMPEGYGIVAGEWDWQKADDPIPSDPSLFEIFFGEGDLSGLTVPVKPAPPSQGVLADLGLAEPVERVTGAISGVWPVFLAIIAAALLWLAFRFLKIRV